MIHYNIGSSNPAAHYFDITIKITSPDPSGQVLRLPAWIPGSYMIRDFARNIVTIKASSGTKKLSMEQLDKASWKIEAFAGPVKVDYRVYAWDLSVRGAHLDTTHGFFNGTSVFLEVIGQSDRACLVDIMRPACAGSENWRLATTLSPIDETAIFDFKFGTFQAENYLELIDHPVEMGLFVQFDYLAHGVRHDVVLSGQFECDIERLKQDLVKICEHHIAMFGKPPPMSRYLFLVMVVGEGYGGLEHRNSTSLLCSRYNLPHPAKKELTEDYRNFLGLCSHEYFHSWNVKRIKPAVFENPDLSMEVYSPLLWAFEGITSYYDDLALVRCGCISRTDYLQLLGQTITRVQRGHGRNLQSAAESSFNAWTKFYKQDENSSNSIVSYYAKGTLIALCIDLKIRQLSDNKLSLDDVMRRLWENYLLNNKGILEFDIQRIISELVEQDLSEFLHLLVYQAVDLPVVESLKTVSVNLSYRQSAGQQDKGGNEEKHLIKSSFGAQVKEIAGGLEIVFVSELGAAQSAGISAGDVIVAINGLRVSMKSFESWLQLSVAGSEHSIHAFRRDEMRIFTLTLLPAVTDTAVLLIIDDSSSSLNAWLGRDRSAKQ